MQNKNALQWIYFVAKRFSAVDKKGSSSFTSRLSMLGIAFGVMTLIVVISVMNGFQREFIDAILEVSSYHIRAQGIGEDERENFERFLLDEKEVLCAVPFVEREALFVSANGKQAAALVRAISADVMETDKGFEEQLWIVRGGFDLETSIAPTSLQTDDDEKEMLPLVLGDALAKSLGVRQGDEVKAYMSFSSSESLVEAFSKPKSFYVSGIFRTGYVEINSSYSFANLLDFEIDGADELIYGIKAKSPAAENAVLKKIKAEFSGASVSHWRDYNKSFFGALRIEKNMLMLLVVLIFVVVAVNIFNSMRRMVFERRAEISTLSALGGKISAIKDIFVLRGFLVGLKGSISGLVLGLFFCVNIKSVFVVLSRAHFYLNYFAAVLFNPDSAAYISENPMFSIYADIPARMYAHEIILISLFGIFSALFSSLTASRYVLNSSISEVLHDE